jgi:hypothetical protein
MQRISNRSHDEKQRASTQVQYVDRIVEVPVASQPADPIIQRIETRVEVPVDRIVEVEKVIHVESAKVDLEPIHTKLHELEARIRVTAQSKNQFIEQVIAELNMQRGALIALKTQRDIDRNRRLMLMKRIKKEHNAHKKTALFLKLAIGASLILSIVSLFVKL